MKFTDSRRSERFKYARTCVIFLPNISVDIFSFCKPCVICTLRWSGNNIPIIIKLLCHSFLLPFLFLKSHQNVCWYRIFSNIFHFGICIFGFYLISVFLHSLLEEKKKKRIENKQWHKQGGEDRKRRKKPTQEQKNLIFKIRSFMRMTVCCFQTVQVLIANLMNILSSFQSSLTDETPLSHFANPPPSQPFDRTSCVAFGMSLHLSFLLYKMAVNPYIVSPTQIAKAYARTVSTLKITE